MLRIIFTLLFVIVAMSTAVISSEFKDRYRPPEQGYPQVIQDLDYATIKAIEFLYGEINRLGDGPLSCNANGHSIRVTLTADTGKDVLIHVPEKGPVTINKTPFVDPNTVTLFTTLRTILTDLSADHKCSGVKGGQYSTRAYKKRTILDFDYEQNIVELESFSNGPGNEERLYTLDVVNRKDSFFFSSH